MEHRIIIVGIGPGAPEYLPPAAKSIIDDAAVLVGSRRALETFGKKGVKQYIINGFLAAAADFIRNSLVENDVVVLVSGDPGYYSMLPYLKNAFPNQKIEVIPGISSMQVAFARLALPWQEATLLSFHGRKPDMDKLSYRSQKILGLLTDTVHTSCTIAITLLKYGWPNNAKAHILSKLSYPDEHILEQTLAETASSTAIENCIMVVADTCTFQA